MKKLTENQIENLEAIEEAGCFVRYLGWFGAERINDYGRDFDYESFNESEIEAEIEAEEAYQAEIEAEIISSLKYELSTEEIRSATIEGDDYGTALGVCFLKSQAVAIYAGDCQSKRIDGQLVANDVEDTEYPEIFVKGTPVAIVVYNNDLYKLVKKHFNGIEVIKR